MTRAPVIKKEERKIEVTSPTITTEIVEVTPDLARDMLGKNTHNRRIRSRHVDELATDMRSGNWQLNGDAIKFDVHGVLLDGQHRLRAIIEADVPVTMMLVWNVQPEAQSTYDVGTRRTFADTLTLRGHTNTLVLATCVRWHWLYKTGNAQANAPATISQLMEHFTPHHESFVEAVRLATQVRSNIVYPASALSATFAEIIIKGDHDDDLDDFIDKLKTGAGLPKGHPVLTFRAYSANVTAAATKPTPVVFFAVFIKTWNAYIEGRQVQALAFRAGGAAPEKFPIIL